VPVDPAYLASCSELRERPWPFEFPAICWPGTSTHSCYLARPQDVWVLLSKAQGACGAAGGSTVLPTCPVGAVAVRMRVYDSSLCFINSHLSSGLSCAWIRAVKPCLRCALFVVELAWYMYIVLKLDYINLFHCGLAICASLHILRLPDCTGCGIHGASLSS